MSNVHGKGASSGIKKKRQQNQSANSDWHLILVVEFINYYYWCVKTWG